MSRDRPAAHRLAASGSVYLRLHAHQEVAWRPWGEDAFDEARVRDVPVLLSVGYATCHWCHVMARESFDDPEVAALMNEGFVCIKVDREARPDVDAVYMAALQAMTRGGGWPMTLALTPDGAPWFAGTYFPPTDRLGMPSFRKVLTALRNAWRERRGEVERAAGEIADWLARDAVDGPATAAPPPMALADAAATPPASERLAGREATVAALLRRTFDADHGGFGGAPKFPPHAALRWLEANPDPDADRMRHRTLRAIVDGGVTDQLGGALHRYATDGAWAVPHFEVMLVDQAQMLPRLARAAAETGDARLAWGALAMLEALERDLARDDGLFATGLDAEAGGVEGAYHCWTPDDVRAAVGDDDAAFAMRAFGVGEVGAVDGRSVLAWRGDGLDPARIARVREDLRRARAARPAPRRDEPAIAGYVGLAVLGLVDAADHLPAPAAERAVALATRAADALWARGWDGARLRRLLDADAAEADHGVALLEDQVHPGRAYLALARRTGDARQLERALALADAVATRHAARDGGFATVPFGTAAPLVRIRDPLDGATPGGEPSAALFLAEASAWAERDDWRGMAEAALERLERAVEAAPQAAATALEAARCLQRPPPQVVVVGPPDDERTVALWRTALAHPSRPCVVRSDGPDDPLAATLPWVAGRGAPGGRPTAYACTAGRCRLPVTDPAALGRELTALASGREGTAPAGI